jgi:hypothetical protein
MAHYDYIPPGYRQDHGKLIPLTTTNPDHLAVLLQQAHAEIEMLKNTIGDQNEKIQILRSRAPQALKAENAKLKERIAELEAELQKKGQ